ncbi:MAG: phage terminase small subunit P27 family [Mesorhizobium sp.]
MKGRPPKPSTIKIAEGNRRKIRADNIRQDIKGNGFPRLPKHLSSDEQCLWLDVIDALPVNLLSRADEAVLERFAVNWARWRTVQNTIVKTGLLVNSPQGPVRNPLLIVQEKAAREMHAAGEVIGLSPVARARLASTDQDGEEDPMALLLGMDGDPNGAWSTLSKTRQ